MQRATLIPFLDFLNRLLIGSKFVWNQQAQSTYGYGQLFTAFYLLHLYEV